MAFGSGFMGDATGGIGQGLAFVLPESKAATYAMNLAQTHAAQLQDMARAKQAAAAKAQAQYEQDFKEQKLPAAFAPFYKELNNRHNAWLADAAKKYATTGKNPFNDPDMVARYNDEVIVPARQSQELGTNYTKLRALAETDPNNKYTKESKQAVIDYEKQMEKDPFSTLNKPLPQLQETPATVDDLVKTLKATKDVKDNGNYKVEGPNSSDHKAQAFAALVGDDKWHPLLKKYGYNPDLPDFAVYTDPKHPNGKRVWYTNTDFTDHQAKLILENKTDPNNQKILKTLGIDPENDTFAEQKLQHAIADQNAAMGKAVTDIAARKDAEVPTETLYTGKLDNMAMRREFHEDLQAQREWQRQQKAEKDSSPTVRMDLIERARTGLKNEDGTGFGDEIQAIIKANSEYQGEMHINYLHKDGKEDKTVQVFNIPEKITPAGASIPAHQVRLDTKKPQEYEAGMNQMLNEITGEKVSLTKATSQHGKGYVPGGVQNPTIKPKANQAPDTKYKAANGKTYTHEQLLKAGYSEERINKYIQEGKLSQ